MQILFSRRDGLTIQNTAKMFFSVFLCRIQRITSNAGNYLRINLLLSHKFLLLLVFGFCVNFLISDESDTISSNKCYVITR